MAVFLTYVLTFWATLWATLWSHFGPLPHGCPQACGSGSANFQLILKNVSDKNIKGKMGVDLNGVNGKDVVLGKVLFALWRKLRMISG